MEELEQAKAAKRAGITAKGGLLWIDGKIIPVPHADDIARAYGFLYAERLVKALEQLRAKK
jgi:hypothetical protein